ncbi:MAG TPA: hypothetical protein VHQ86_01605 [Candidatus Saccharimonadia bacterium]|jgi:hypothetical protein|nr:hypothetical protein [Candidatus Saccharimonadia bacterium]
MSSTLVTIVVVVDDSSVARAAYERRASAIPGMLVIAVASVALLPPALLAAIEAGTAWLIYKLEDRVAFSGFLAAARGPRQIAAWLEAT